MGSGSSKKAPPSSSSSSSSCSNDGLGRKKEERKKRRRLVFRSPCFGSDHQMKKKEINGKPKHITHTLQIEENPNEVRNEKPSSSSYSSTQIPEFHTSNSEHSEENQETRSIGNSIPDSSSSSTINADNNKSKTRFKFTQGNVSFRLNRALSLGSSMSHNLFSTNNDHNNTNNTNINNTTNNLSDENTTQQEEETISETVRTNNINTNRSRTTIRTQEIENNVRFSRTLSVGRLRDRVLRRTPFSDILSDEMTGNNINVRRALRRAGSYSHNMSELITHGDNNNNVGNNVGNYGNENESNRELLERRSAFLERRRRIRSQVRALQRLGSRRMTSEERSCVMSGRHRTDTCTCRLTTNRTGTGTSDDDESGTRRSISRIVLLAEALFEVLDEIHQQSVVLSSSRASFSSIGSVPAPKETVESLPVKFYKKNPKSNEDICQCYICLVEYEEGDGMRVLPCNHEFHLTCVDKWLKEIHRVCPLCRGDVCRAADASIVGK